MYCPNCGKTNSAEQKFCRSCGLSLEKVVQSLTEQLSASDLDNNLQDRQRRVERWATIIGGSAVSILVLAVLWGVIYEIIIVKGDVAEGLVFLAFILGIVFFALLMLYRESLVKASKRPLPEPTLAQPGNTAKPLREPSFEPMVSVTERTTELLTVDKKDGPNLG